MPEMTRIGKSGRGNRETRFISNKMSRESGEKKGKKEGYK